jgi:hypothetical protein
LLLNTSTKNPKAGASIPQFTSGDKLAIGILIGVVGLLLTSSIDLRRLTGERAQEDRELGRVIARSADLKRISDGLDQMCRRDPSRLLATLFEKSSHELGNRIIKSADTLELEISPRLGDTRSMLGCMSGEVCRFVHYLDNTMFLTDNLHSVQFWEDLHEELRARDVRRIERLLVLRQDESAARDQLQDESIRRLIGMHLTEKNYSCAVIDGKGYDELQLQHYPAGTRFDVGIYGDRFIYISEQIPAAEPHSAAADVVGRLVADPERIAQAVKFFEDCWRQALEPERIISKYGLEPFPKVHLWAFLNPNDPEPQLRHRMRRRADPSVQANAARDSLDGQGVGLLLPKPSPAAQPEASAPPTACEPLPTDSSDQGREEAPPTEAAGSMQPGREAASSEPNSERQSQP